MFSTLINLATTAVTTLWRPLIYPLARNVLHRLNSYLTYAEDSGLSSPGSLIVARSTESSSGNNG